jgi:hypothetical protein
LKHIENKYNLIVNNYPNSSHVREVVEKTKELEKLVTRAPQPHRSWRKLVLVLICVGAVLFVTVKMGQKYASKWLSNWLNLESSEHGPRVSIVNEQVARRSVNDKMSVLDLKNLVDQHMIEHKQRMDFLLHKLNDVPLSTLKPTTD